MFRERRHLCSGPFSGRSGHSRYECDAGNLLPSPLFGTGRSEHYGSCCSSGLRPIRRYVVGMATTTPGPLNCPTYGAHLWPAPSAYGPHCTRIRRNNLSRCGYRPGAQACRGGEAATPYGSTPSTMPRDTNDTKSMARDIGTTPKGRMVPELSQTHMENSDAQDQSLRRCRRRDRPRSMGGLDHQCAYRSPDGSRDRAVPADDKRKGTAYYRVCGLYLRVSLTVGISQSKREANDLES
jgi:hypothetical protein